MGLGSFIIAGPCFLVFVVWKGVWLNICGFRTFAGCFKPRKKKKDLVIFHYGVVIIKKNENGTIRKGTRENELNLCGGYTDRE